MKITLPTERVSAMFSSISGESAEQYYDLCAVAARSIINRIKRGADCAARESELIYAAACLANYRFVLSRCSDGVDTYKAGDMSIGNDIRSSLAAAKALLCDALRSVSDCLVSDSFCFKSI